MVIYPLTLRQTLAKDSGDRLSEMLLIKMIRYPYMEFWIINARSFLRVEYWISI